MVNKPFGDIITFSRASGGGRFNSSGVYEWVGNNVPRFDHDPVTGQPLGILIEPQRTNLYENSQIIGGSIGTTAIINSVVAPDGTTTADQLIEDGMNGEHYSADRGISITAGGNYTFSVFVKPLASGSARMLYLRVAAGGNVFGSFFDMVSKTHQVQFGPAEVGYQELPYGWFRAWIKFNATATGTSVFRLQLASYSSPPSFYVGDGVSGLALWGAQVEQGGTGLSSYIPTGASQVTRAADVASVNTLSPWYNASEGTFEVSSRGIVGRPLLTAGSAVITADSAALKDYSLSYTTDPSALKVDIGLGLTSSIKYFPRSNA